MEEEFEQEKERLLAKLTKEHQQEIAMLRQSHSAIISETKRKQWVRSAHCGCNSMELDFYFILLLRTSLRRYIDRKRRIGCEWDARNFLWYWPMRVEERESYGTYQDCLRDATHNNFSRLLARDFISIKKECRNENFEIESLFFCWKTLFHWMIYHWSNGKIYVKGTSDEWRSKKKTKSPQATVLIELQWRHWNFCPFPDYKNLGCLLKWQNESAYLVILL